MRMLFRSLFQLACVGVLLGSLGAIVMPANANPQSSNQDTRASSPPQNLDTPRTFPHFSTLAEWENRKSYIRRQILVSCGLYPMPAKTPLKPKITGRVERDGYTIEKVSIQTYPGFFLAGNLYRPFGLSVPRTKHPGVLVTHGHWENGRMANEERGSICARAITFARQGIVAFTYDMVGYNDTHQISHTFAGDRGHWVWGISLMGLQTWNSIRALDFLISLKDVDASKLAITGESGGGTQTMILGAIDDRLAAVGPCVMVSHSMQGGCLCENAPGLRKDFSNMEVAACAAPKPQIMVGATGDWTRTMMSVEGPGVESIYKLYGKPDNLKYVIFNYVHNINKTSREAVYQAFGKWLLNQPGAETYREPPYKMEAVEDLRVFPDAVGLPKEAISADTLTEHLKSAAVAALDSIKPQDADGLSRFKKELLPIWKQTLGLEIPETVSDSVLGLPGVTTSGELSVKKLRLHRPGKQDSIPCILLEPEQKKPGAVAVLTGPNGSSDFFLADGSKPNAMVAGLLSSGNAVLLVDTFLTGEASNAVLKDSRNLSFQNYFDTYNRTNMQERVQDLVTAVTYMRRQFGKPVVISGIGSAGLTVMLAAPAADGVAADGDHMDLSSDEPFTSNDTYVPCLRRMGDVKACLALCAPHPLAIFNVGDGFTAGPWVQDVYQAIGETDAFSLSPSPVDLKSLLAVIAAAKKLGAR